MYQAIITKFLPATNHRGSRVKAVAEAGNMAVCYDHGRDAGGAHLAAAEALAEKMGWSGIWVGGEHDTGYAFVRLGLGADLRNSTVDADLVVSFLIASEEGRSWFRITEKAE